MQCSLMKRLSKDGSSFRASINNITDRFCQYDEELLLPSAYIHKQTIISSAKNNQ